MPSEYPLKPLTSAGWAGGRQGLTVSGPLSLFGLLAFLEAPG